MSAGLNVADRQIGYKTTSISSLIQILRECEVSGIHLNYVPSCYLDETDLCQ